MVFGFGTGFLSTDPRTKKGPKGGSIHAAQDTDTSVINTGDPRSGSIGFASKSAFTGGGMFENTGLRPTSSPEYQKKTAQETKELRASRGVASSQQNMGSLAVGFRASEQAKKDSGQETVAGKRATRILDARADSEYQRTVLEPAAAEQSKFRAQAAGAQKFMGKFMTSAKSDLAAAKSGVSPRSNSGGSRVLMGSKRSSDSSNSSKGLGLKTKQDATRSGGLMGPKPGVLTSQLSKDFQSIKENPDPLALDAQRAHSEAPGTQAISWQDMANAQSASGRATASEMAQAAVSMHARETPNKPNR